LLGTSAGCGTVFKFDTAGHETLLYRFTGENDGGFPDAGLAMDISGNLYGTALWAAILLVTMVSSAAE
jgi:uncharacterized repeat protein (TIGR03803 family)